MIKDCIYWWPLVRYGRYVDHYSTLGSCPLNHTGAKLSFLCPSSSFTTLRPVTVYPCVPIVWYPVTVTCGCIGRLSNMIHAVWCCVQLAHRGLYVEWDLFWIYTLLQWIAHVHVDYLTHVSCMGAIVWSTTEPRRGLPSMTYSTVSVNSTELRRICHELQGKIYKQLWPSPIRKKPSKDCAHFHQYITLFMEA